MPDDFAFFDFRREQFPVQMWILDAETRELRWYVQMDGMCAVEVPAKAEMNDGKPVMVVVRDATGRTSIAEPDPV